MSNLKPAGFLGFTIVEGLMLIALSSARADDGQSTKSNTERTRIPLSRSNDERIHEVLSQATAFEFVHTPLADAINYVKEKHEIEIQFDKLALDDAGISLDSPVEKCLRNVSLRSALRLLLRDVDLTFVVKDEVILITTPNRLLVTKVYDVHDLAPEGGYDRLVQDIVDHVAATKWKQAGGAGSISRFSSNGVEALIVTQSDAVHNELESLLADLRRLRKASKDKP